MSFDRTKWSREYARKMRAKKLALQRARRERCPYRLGRYVCGGRLTFPVDQFGNVHSHCQKCARREAGICQDCPLPVEGMVRKALRCKACKKRVAVAATNSYVERNKRKVLEKARRYARLNRERNSRYKKLWRKANPEKVQAQKRREALRQLARTRAYHRDYNREHGTQPRSRPGTRSCVTCPTPVQGRRKQCEPCRIREREAARRALGWAA